MPVLSPLMLGKWIVQTVRYLNCRILVYNAQFLKRFSTLLVIFANFMADERCGNDRRGMTISVIFLGITLSVVFLAYFAFSENLSSSDVSTVRFAVVVSIL